MKTQLLIAETQLHNRETKSESIKRKLKTAVKSTLLISMLFFCFTSSAQVIGTYVFTTNNTTVRDTMSSPTIQLIGSTRDDSVSALTTFTALTNGAGFTFSFNGTPYTQFSVSSNGLLQLGAQIASIDTANAINSANFNPKIAPYWDNLHTGNTGGGGKVHCKMIGSSPSRKLVVEWFVTVPRNAAASANAKIQVWLYESTHATTSLRNVVQIVYGTGLVANTTNAGYSVGMANSSASSNFWSVTTSAHTASSTVANVNTVAINYGRSYIFTPPALPGCAGSLVPANAATNQAITTTLSWVAGTGSPTGYDVYFGTPASPPLVVTNQPGTTYNPGTLLANTTYFWKIAPRNAGGPATMCAIISFTTLAVPPCATTFAPANGTTGVSALTPSQLSWASGGGTVTGYDVYLDTNATPVTLVSSNQAGTTYTPGALLPNKTYFWRIAPRNSSGAATGCTITSFTTLALPPCATTFSPANGTTGVLALTPTQLSWASGGGTVTGYDVYLDTNATPVTLVSSNQAGTTYTPGALIANKTYFWRIAPRNSSGAATGCTITSFTTLALPSCAINQSPSNGATSQPIVGTTLSWTTGGGTVTGYDVYFGTVASPPLVVTGQAGTTYNPGTLLAGTTYFWKIAPRNGSGPATTCVTISFTTLAIPPCATSLAPANAATNQPITTTLSWASGGGTVTAYDVYFGTIASPPLISADQAGTTYNPGTLLANTTYFWKIVPKNASGPATGCSTISFTTLAVPPCATSLAPANAATNQAITTTLSWASGGGTVTGYDVYFGTVASPPLVSTGQAGTTYNPGTLLAGTTYFWKIVPKNSSGTATGCTTISFTTLAVPPCATSLAPANGATNQTITTTLSWATGGGTVTGYDVYFGTATTPPLVVTGQAGTTYNPGTLLAGTTYYWKIAPRNGSGPATGCSTISFTTLALPPCATSLSPANGATGQVITTTLSWATGGGTVTGYDVYFGTAASPPLVVTGQAGTTYNPGTLLAGTTYFWKIAPRNGSGPATGCSIFSFTTLAVPPCATSFSPASGSTGVPALSVTLSWATGGGTVTGYDVYLDTLAAPVNLRSSNQAGTTYAAPALIQNKIYYWKIVPRNSSGPATGCVVSSFTTLAVPTTCASSFTPVNGTTGVPALSAALSWRTAPGIVTGYNVYLDTLASPVNLVSANQPDTTFNPAPLLINRTYYWKIVPRNGSGPATTVCAITSFTTLALPACATGLSPANGATGTLNTPTLTWASGNGTIIGYDVYFGNTSSPPLVEQNNLDTTYFTGTLTPGSTYFWKIAPRNGSGPATTCSTISFTTLALPPCAASLAPANGATGLSINTTLSWTSGGTPTATGYDVHFGTNPSPPVVASNQAGLTYNPGTLLPGTTYYWQILPRNSSGSPTGCAIFSFTTLAVPSCATSFTPANGATAQLLTTTLSWVSGGGTVTGYDVYFGTAASPPLVVTGQVGTTYNPGALAPGTTYFWKIVPKNANGTATGCSTNSFTTLALPVCASNYSPADAAAGVAVNSTLSWTSGGAPTPTGYDVYFGTAASPPLVVTNQAGTTYNPGALANGTTYYWKIVPRNSSGLATGCSVNSFITIFPGVPVCAINLSPANGASGLATSTTLSWASGGAPAPTSYDVYFSTSQTLVASSNPAALIGNQAGTTYAPVLAAGTTYYWKILPRNAAGLAAGCSVSQFTIFGPVNYDVTRNTSISYGSISSTGNIVSFWRGSVDTDDNLSDSIPIGFNFMYQGIARSRLLISLNGFVTFNTSTTSIGDASGAAYGPGNTSFSATGATGSTLTLAPFYEDLVCQGSSFQQAQLNASIKYLTTGTSPNRVFTVEWISMERYQNPGPDLNFQVKLYESNNNIEYVYGTMQGFDGSKNFSYNYTCGMNAATITAPHPAGEILTQQLENTRSFGNTPADGLTIAPECNSRLLFTPGNYTPYVPGGSSVPNDNPASAIAITPNSLPCVNLCGTYYTSAGATASTSVPTCTGTANADVWFQFIATSPSTTIRVRASGGYDPVVQLLNNSLSNLVCQNILSNPGMTETISATTLTTGNNYYVRVYNYSGGWGVNGTFSICINATPAPPVNDSCPGAIQLNTDTAMIFVTGTNTTVATEQLSAPAPCNSTTADDDVWYSFIAPAPTVKIEVQGSGTFMPAIQIFSGSCASLTTLQCVAGPGQIKIANLTGLLPGATYRLRVYHAGTGAASGSFVIGISTQKPGCPTTFVPATGTAGVPSGGTIFRWSKGFNAAGYDVYLDTVNPPIRRIATNVPDTSFQSGPLGTIPEDQTFYWTVVARNAEDTSALCYVNLFAATQSDIVMNLKIFIEGFYLPGSGGMMNAVLDPVLYPDVTDSITVTLYDTLLFEPMFTLKAALSTTGYAQCIFPSEAGGSFYHIAVNHRNSIETWSKVYFFDVSDTLVNLTSPPDSLALKTDLRQSAPAGQHYLPATNANRNHSSGSIDGNRMIQYERALLYLRNNSDRIHGDIPDDILNAPADIVIDLLALMYLSTP